MNKKFSQWAESQGLTASFDSASRMEGDYFVSYYCIATSGMVRADVYVDAETICSKEEQKEIKKELKKTGSVAFDAKKGIVYFTPSSGKSQFDKLTEGTGMLLDKLKQYRIAPLQVCHLCKKAGATDTHFDESGAKFVPVHTECKRQHIHTQLAEIEENEQSGSVGRGMVGAVLGGIVGIIPSIITIVAFNYIFGYLMALIPLASYYGYKLFKGRLNRAVPYFISIISLVCSILMVLVYNYVDLSIYLEEMLPISDFIEIMFLPEVLSECIGEYAQALLFCALGIFIMWQIISKSNSRKKEILEASRKSSME